MNDLIHKELKILVLGAAGAGKSSLINLFHCWSNSWNLSDIIRNKKVLIKTRYFEGDGEAEGDLNRQCQSQTKKAKLYEFYLQLAQENTKYLLKFLDTPGIGDDTRGYEQDNANIRLILNTIAKTEDLNAIILVLNGTEARHHSHIQLVSKKLRSMIPNFLAENLIVLLTNVELEPLLNVKELFDFPIDDRQIFFYNNLIFNLHPQYFNNKNILFRAQQAYDASIETIYEMFKRISKIFPITTKSFASIQEIRNKFKKDVINFGEIIHTSIIQISELQKLHHHVMEDNVQFSELLKLSNRLATSKNTWKTTPTEGCNIICMTCKNTCWKNLRLNGKEIRSQRFKNLVFDSSEVCKHCHHSYSVHGMLAEVYIKNKEQAEKVPNNIKLALEEAIKKRDPKTAISKVLCSEIERIDQEIRIAKRELLKLVASAREICSMFDYFKEINCCIKVFQEKLADFQKNKDEENIQKDQNNEIQALHSVKKMTEKLKNRMLDDLRSSPPSKIEEAEISPNNQFSTEEGINPQNKTVINQRASSRDSKNNCKIGSQRASSLGPCKTPNKVEISIAPTKQHFKASDIGDNVGLSFVAFNFKIGSQPADLSVNLNRPDKPFSGTVSRKDLKTTQGMVQEMGNLGYNKSVKDSRKENCFLENVCNSNKEKELKDTENYRNNFNKIFDFSKELSALKKHIAETLEEKRSDRTYPSNMEISLRQRIILETQKYRQVLDRTSILNGKDK